MRALMWFRSDLRVKDNTALDAACRAAEEVIGLFVVSPAEWGRHDYSAARIDLTLRTLRPLGNALLDRGIPLLVEHASKPSNVPTLVIKTAREHGCASVHLNREYEVDESRRDEQTIELGESAGIKVIAHHDQAIIPPGQLRSQEGRAYTVFTPFKNAWVACLEDLGLPEVRSLPRRLGQVNVRPSPIPAHVRGFKPTIAPDLWPAGEDHASGRMRSFVRSRLSGYDTDRNFPSLEGTSALSPYLANGSISARQCLAAAVAANPTKRPLSTGNAGAVTWISELIWRDFYIHILAAFPRVCMGRAFRHATERVQWRYSNADLDAWKRGRTGVPIVDAGMRQLLETGWMHNRVRMITAMFLSKNLLLNWRDGERHFMQNLVDGFFASNNGGWQWAASTGTDAAPYFRVFNPVSQSRKFDSRGGYIRRYVPELRDLDDDSIHEPWTMPELARSRVEYPDPIVDLASSRTRAIDAFRSAKA